MRAQRICSKALAIKSGVSWQERPMHVAVSGASGLIGRRLLSSLRNDGHRVRPLVRPASGPNMRDDPDAISWDPADGTIDHHALEGLEAVVNLAAAGVGDRRWSEAYKRQIRESRIGGTELISRSLAELDQPPKVLIAACGIAYYGDRGDEVLVETSDAGEGFLAEVDSATEQATEPARAAGIRVVLGRSGMVLSASGGALRRMLLPFRLGLGGWFGSGRQWWSWISLDDEVRAIRFLLDNDDIAGPVNLTGPAPVTNRQFTKALGRALHRPALVRAPLLAPRLLAGRELTQDMVLASRRVIPAVLERAGYRFLYSDIDSALHAALQD